MPTAHMVNKPVERAQILKISVLLALLVTLPRNLYFYNMFTEGKLDFSGEWVADLIYRLSLLFLYSWLILHLNANLAYRWKGVHTILHQAVLIIVDIGILLATLWLWKVFHQFIFDNPPSREDLGYMHFRYAILTLVLFFIARILRLLKDQQEGMVAFERLKQENLRNELAAIKNQVDPHFLFNSLNSLSSLVRENEPASQFVRKLAYIYRYILQNGDTDLVTLADELKFLESYTYLIKTRYRDRFEIDINVAPELHTATLPPMALQLLVENAVKHNEISESNPLKVEIFSEDGILFVRNRIQPRTTLPDASGYGLTNLEKRFALLKKVRINVSEENGMFTVSMPLKKGS